jgi:hypothetical protein
MVLCSVTLVKLSWGMGAAQHAQGPKFPSVRNKELCFPFDYYNEIISP